MSELMDKLNKVEEKIKENNENSLVSVVEDDKKPTKAQEISDAISILSDHQNLVKSKIGQDLMQKFNSGQFDDEINDTSKTIAKSAFTQERSDAEEKMGKATLSLDETYFNLHKEELKSCGIKERTYMDRMQKAVQTNHNWWDVYFNLILWWACGLNVFANNIARWESKFLKVIVWIFLTPVLAIFVPIFIAVGILRTAIYLMCKSVVWFISLFKSEKKKNNKPKKQEVKQEVKETPEVVVVYDDSTELKDDVKSYKSTEKQTKKNKNKEG